VIAPSRGVIGPAPAVARSGDHRNGLKSIMSRGEPEKDSFRA